MKTLMTAVLLLAATTLWAQNDGTMMRSDKPAGDGSMMRADTSAKPDPSAYDLKGLGPQVLAFTSEKDAQQWAKTKTVVYFFAATWCPDCQATYRDIQAHWSAIPPNLVLIFVNYDKSYDLKKKYAVTAQHTFVVVGAAGEKKKIWNGSTTVADLIKTATAR